MFPLVSRSSFLWANISNISTKHRFVPSGYVPWTVLSLGTSQLETCHDIPTNAKVRGVWSHNMEHGFLLTHP